MAQERSDHRRGRRRATTRAGSRLALLLAGLVPFVALTACAPTPPRLSAADERFALAPAPAGKVPQRFRRQSVAYASSYAPGTVVVDTDRRFLYLVESGSRALRYGVGIGIGAKAWSGTATVGAKRPWPRWTPPREMIAHSPALSRYSGGLEGGGINPLGARALYLHQGGRDTLYRLHGTPEWWTIGQSGSSGCVRLLNEDIIDLYERVPVGAQVVVLPRGSPARPG